MQKVIVEEADILDDNGELIQTGWAKRLLLKYNRDKIKSSDLRIKEWDYYEITNQDYSLVLLIYDIGYFAQAQIDWVDFRKQFSTSSSKTILMSRGSLNFPPSSDEGDISFIKGNSKIIFEKKGNERIFTFNMPDFMDGQGISGKITLFQDPEMDTMVNVIPFKNKKHFVYAQKINCMPATGKVKIGGDEYEFSEDNNSYACLDWSRGVFPYKVGWEWCTASGKVKGIPFGFNIDYGFGTESSKSMIFYDGKGHHLDEVVYKWDKKDLKKPWIFTSNDDRVNMKLEPVYLMICVFNVGFGKQDSTRLYGYFVGDVVLDDGKKIRIERSDNLLGFAEFDRYKW